MSEWNHLLIHCYIRPWVIEVWQPIHLLSYQLVCCKSHRSHMLLFLLADT